MSAICVFKSEIASVCPCLFSSEGIYQFCSVHCVMFTLF